MAKTNITLYSSTPSSNTDINNINIDENCPASGLNNAIRELMSHLKNVDTGSQALTALSVTGNLLVGKTSADTTVQGAELRESGFNAFVRDTTHSGESVLLLNKKNYDGVIQIFQKDNTTVGSIQASAGNLLINTNKGSISHSANDIVIYSSDSGHNGLRMHDSGILPTDNTGQINNNDANLGHPDYRFKDLYLGGGVYLGGTGSANYLDDYEEGTWTPAVTVGTVTASYGFYTKIGRQVFISGRIGNFSNTTNNEVLYVQGLPFVDGSGDTVLFGTSMVEGVDKDFGYEVVLINVNDRLRFFHSTNADADPLRHIDLDSSSSIIYFQGTYFV